MSDNKEPPKSAEMKIIKQTSEVKETTSAVSAARDSLVETRHTITIGGQQVKYTAIAGTMLLKEEPAERDQKFVPGKPRAQLFLVAYTKDDVEDLSRRPITFCFNGGPGSSFVLDYERVRPRHGATRVQPDHPRSGSQLDMEKS